MQLPVLLLSSDVSVGRFSKFSGALSRASVAQQLDKVKGDRAHELDGFHLILAIMKLCRLRLLGFMTKSAAKVQGGQERQGRIKQPLLAAAREAIGQFRYGNDVIIRITATLFAANFDFRAA